MADNVLDEMIRRDVQLQRVATSIKNKYITPTAQDIAAEVGKMLLGYEDLNAAEKRTLINDIKRYTSESWGGIWIGFSDEITPIMEDEGQFVLELYDDYTPDSEELIAPKSLPPANAVMSTGTQAGVWSEFVAANIGDTVKAVNAVTQSGVRDGATVQQMINQLRGTYNRRTKQYENGILTGKQARRAESLVRTGVSHHVSGVRDRFAQDNKDVISKRVFFATLDNRTTTICLSNHLREWDVDDDSYPRLPLHFNERSVYVFRTRSFNPLSQTRPVQVGESDGKTEFEQVSAKLSASAWLKRQPRWFIEQTLGKTRAELFIDGNLDIKSMVDVQNKPLTIEQLKNTTKGARAFRKVNDG